MVTAAKHTVTITSILHTCDRDKALSRQLTTTVISSEAKYETETLGEYLE